MELRQKNFHSSSDRKRDWEWYWMALVMLHNRWNAVRFNYGRVENKQRNIRVIYMPLKATCNIGFFVNWKINLKKLLSSCLWASIKTRATSSSLQKPVSILHQPKHSLSDHNLCDARQNPYHKFDIGDVIEKTFYLICPKLRWIPNE